MRGLPSCLRLSFSDGNSSFQNSHSLSASRSLARASRHLPLITCATRDGKKRRPKTGQSTAQEQAPETLSSSPSPPRVQVHSLLPARTQIRIVREYKKIQESSAYRKPPVSQTYRKESKAVEEYRREKEEAETKARELSKEESKNFALSKLYKTAAKDGKRVRAVLAPPVLLVDGYNVLHKWERTSPLLAKGEPETAREVLIEALGMYSQQNGVRVVVAFDAMQGPSSTVTETLLSTGVTVAYCGDCEADSFIEEQVGVWLERKHPYVVVATSDVAHSAVIDSKSDVKNKHIVFVVPSSGLCKDIEATEKRLQQQLDEVNLREGRVTGVLGSAVKSKNANAFEEMKKMRVSLPTAIPTVPLKKKAAPPSPSENGSNGKT